MRNYFSRFLVIHLISFVKLLGNVNIYLYIFVCEFCFLLNCLYQYIYYSDGILSYFINTYIIVMEKLSYFINTYIIVMEKLSYFINTYIIVMGDFLTSFTYEGLFINTHTIVIRHFLTSSIPT